MSERVRRGAGPVGRSVRRGARLLDAASWKASDAGMPVSGLGVPLSVWPDALPGKDLAVRLVGEFSRPGDLVVSSLVEGLCDVAALGRCLVLMCRPRRVPVAERELDGLSASFRALVRVEAVTRQNLGARLTRAGSDVDLLVVEHGWCTGVRRLLQAVREEGSTMPSDTAHSSEPS